MGRRSSIKSGPPEVKRTIDELIREGRLTLDEILEAVRERHAEAHGDDIPSRSSLGRYRASLEEQMAAVRESREVADVWAKRLGEEPDSDIGKVVLEMLRTIAYRTGSDLLTSGEGVNAKEISQLARAMQQIEDAGRLGIAREKAVRDAALAEAEQRLDQLGHAKGGKKPDAETLALVRAAIRGEA